MQHSKMKIAPAIIGYIGIIDHTIKVRIPNKKTMLLVSSLT